MLYILGLMIVFFVVYYLIRKKLVFAETVSGAIVMALGVFSLNVGPQLFPDNRWYKALAFLTIIIWAFLIVSYIASVLTGNFKKLHYDHPIGRFRIGTWIAGTSVTIMLINKYFPASYRVIVPLVVLNTLLWLVFAGIFFYSLTRIWKWGNKWNVNGIVLLTTVSTQSLVLMYNNIWNHFYIYFYINAALIAIGCLFYIFSAVLIIRHYMRSVWNLANDWQAPNCILHGALSIIGSAAVISQTFNSQQLLAFWMIVLSLFLCLETAEIVRGVHRVKVYGVKSGLTVYDSSQWSRVFTFCMFYTFTGKLHAGTFTQALWVEKSQQMVLTYGKWIIALLVIIEISLMVRSMLQQSKIRQLIRRKRTA